MSAIDLYLSAVAEYAEKAEIPDDVKRALTRAANRAIQLSGKLYRLHHDFETFCAADIKKVGSDNYSRHPSCEVLMCAYAANDEDILQWVPAEGEAMPKDLREMLLDPNALKFAWNKPFEWAIWANVLDIKIPHEQWRDPMVMAFSLSMPGKLEKVGPIVDLNDDQVKMSDGAALIREFCVPRKPTKTKPWTRTLPHHEPVKWERFKLYNRRDTGAERLIYHRLKPFDLPEREWKLWALDQKINQAGIPINLDLVHNAQEVFRDMKEDRKAKVRKITGIANPNSNKDMLDWLRQYGYPFTDLKKGHVSRAFEKLAEQFAAGEFDDDEQEHAQMLDVKRVLELRLEIGASSPTKYDAIERATDRSGDIPVLRNCFQFAGAGRTWRWAGRIYQPQNLPRPDKPLEKKIAVHVKALEKFSLIEIETIYPVVSLLKAGIRPAAQAPKGFVFIDADLNAIENRVLGWLSGCSKILEIFRLGLDPYIAFATYLFGGEYEDLLAEYKSGDSFKRTIAKPGVLGCFASDTPVLTDKGWKRIVDVKADDLVHDGVQFVRHGGVAYRGKKKTVDLSGVHVTPDHEFLIGQEWIPACQLVKNPRISSWARGTANGLLSGNRGVRAALGGYTSAVAAAGLSEQYRDSTSFSARQLDAIPALRKIGEARSEKELGQNYTTYLQIVSTLRDLDAKTSRTQLTNITAVGEFVCGSVPQMSGYLSSPVSGQTETWNATDGTTTEIMSREICGSRHDHSRTQTSETWDILNAGPNSRFVVLTEDGPLVAHNCGYMLSAGKQIYNRTTGEIEATGLLGYAWGMGIRQFTQEQSDLSVETFRREFKEVVDYWYAMERAAMRCVRTGKETACGVITFDRKGPFLRMILPSGRALHYCRPRIEPVKMPWGKIKDSLTYEGLNDKNQWERITTHPGKIVENADQAIARDLLGEAMLRADDAGIDLRIHVHDQLVGLSPTQKAQRQLKILIDCLNEPPDWAPDMPLGSEGHISPIFMKV